MIVVKKFSAVYCGPCRMLAPIFESQIKPSFSNVKFENIDVDENPSEASKYFISSVPAVVIIKDGKEVGRFTGLQSVMTYKNAINESLT